MPKSVAIVTPVFPPYRGGMGRVAETDATQLAELGYDVHVYAPGAKPAKPAKKEAGGYSLHRLNAWFLYGHAAFAPSAARLLARHDAVILHFPFFGTAEPMALVRAVSKKRRGKLLISYHMDVAGKGLIVPLFSAPTNALIPAIMRVADRVLVTSFDYAKSSRVAPVLAEKPELFRELPPCVDTERFAPDPGPNYGPDSETGPKGGALRERWGIPPGAPVVAFVGGLDAAHYFKGVPILLRAFAFEGLSSARLVIVGDGELKKKYQDHAAFLGVADRVIFAGGVSDAELPELLRMADVFAFPSLDRSEAFGIAALEAMSSGVPVVASDLPGVRTIVRRGETGILVPAGSSSSLALALAKLCGDAQMRQSLGTAARRMVVEEYGYASRKERLAMIMNELGL